MRGRRTSRRHVLAAGGAFLVSALAGCHDDGEPGELGEAQARVDVEARTTDGGGEFSPPVVHLVEGGTIVWTAEGGTHDVTAYHPETLGSQRRIPGAADPWTSGPLEDGETFDHTYEQEGVYDYACTRNESDAMCGTVVIGWPDPDEEPGLDPPSEDHPAAARDALEGLNARVREFLEETHED